MVVSPLAEPPQVESLASISEEWPALFHCIVAARLDSTFLVFSSRKVWKVPGTFVFRSTSAEVPSEPADWSEKIIIQRELHISYAAHDHLVNQLCNQFVHLYCIIIHIHTFTCTYSWVYSENRKDLCTQPWGVPVLSSKVKGAMTANSNWGLFVSKSNIQLQSVVKQGSDEGDLILKVYADWVEDSGHYLWLCGLWMHTGEVPDCQACCLWCDREPVSQST